MSWSPFVHIRQVRVAQRVTHDVGPGSLAIQSQVQVHGLELGFGLTANLAFQIWIEEGGPGLFRDRFNQADEVVLVLVCKLKKLVEGCEAGFDIHLDAASPTLTSRNMTFRLIFHAMVPFEAFAGCLLCHSSLHFFPQVAFCAVLAQPFSVAT